MTNVLFVYVTTKDISEAKKIALAVVSEKLAACANILPQMNSIYRWEDKIHDESEAVMILKTTNACFGSLAKRVKELHSYDTPCIVALPIEHGSKEYLDWIEKNSGSKTSDNKS